MKLPAVTQRSAYWLSLFVIWFGTLWVLSSGPVTVKTGVEIPHLDKLAHFGYFFGGSGLLCAYLYRVFKEKTDWTKMLTIVVLMMTAIGCLDEWHQSWVPERSGNDAQDLCADIIGSIAGFWVFRRCSHWLDHP